MVAGAGFELAAGSNKIKRLCFRPSITAQGPGRKQRPNQAPPSAQIDLDPATSPSNPGPWSVVLGPWALKLGPRTTTLVQARLH